MRSKSEIHFSVQETWWWVARWKIWYKDFCQVEKYLTFFQQNSLRKGYKYVFSKCWTTCAMAFSPKSTDCLWRCEDLKKKKKKTITWRMIMDQSFIFKNSLGQMCSCWRLFSSDEKFTWDWLWIKWPFSTSSKSNCIVATFSPQFSCFVVLVTANSTVDLGRVYAVVC